MSDIKDWALSMHQIENCSCSHGCGCQFGGFPDSENGGCEAILGFLIIDGHYGDLDLSGLKMVFAAMWPKAMHEGNGKGVLFIDSAANSDQITALATIMSGQANGMPLEALATTFSAFEGPIIKDIEMNASDTHSWFSIAGVTEAQQRPLKNPVSGEDQNVHITFPDGGFMWNDGIIGTTDKMSMNYGDIAFDHVGQFAAKAVVNWSNA
ncbi:DUF1326 domain-containing protein [Shewanella abyssi]|uniref:DUF1326 domain-containing protein n=1 Tax=Shewanella abyssi TaxID=311789 RepID=UPI00200D8BCD|nr:DUF1326 domain-containing protein [Shewanella abyssi]MCL1049915.1 DUF1326 domain-containing protein [Shewanella abyssi]